MLNFRPKHDWFQIEENERILPRLLVNSTKKNLGFFFVDFKKSKFVLFRQSVNLLKPGSCALSKVGLNQFSHFDVFWIQGNKSTNKRIYIDKLLAWEPSFPWSFSYKICPTELRIFKPDSVTTFLWFLSYDRTYI